MVRSLQVAGIMMMLTTVGWVWADSDTRPPCVRTDRKVYPEPPLPKLPKAGETFVDPTFGTTILRVTDERDGKTCHNAYSYWPTFNTDNTRFHINRGGTPTLYRFDPKEFKVLGREKLFAVKTPAGTVPRWEDSIWSATDPDVIFAHEGLRLWSHNVAEKEYTLLKDFNESFAHAPNFAISQISRSLDDEVFALSLKVPGGKDAGCAAWRRRDDKVLFHRGLVGSLDEVQIDKSGKWLLIKERKGRIESWVADVQTGHVEGLTDAAPDFGPGTTGTAYSSASSRRPTGSLPWSIWATTGARASTSRCSRMTRTGRW